MINCQTKNIKKISKLLFFLILTIPSCSTKQEPIDKSSRKIHASWGNIDKKFYFKDEKEIPHIHNFFDVDPRIENFTGSHETNFIINYVVTTPEKSKFEYEVDLLSGRLYRSKNYCDMKDVWQNYRGVIDRPNFTTGIVPRVFDQLKKPMKIFIFSDSSKVEPFKKGPEYFDYAKVIGSVITETCLKYPCQKEDWKKNQILIGINARDEKDYKINSFTDLKNKIDWNYFKAFVENSDGVHKLGKSTYPRKRVIQELNLIDSHTYFKKNSSIVTSSRLKALSKWRESCVNMYDQFYTSSEKARELTNGAQRFLEIFTDFYSKHYNQFKSCIEFVRPSNILEDARRHWFFTYVHAVQLLNENGLYYSCPNNAWTYNPQNADGSFFVSQKDEFRRCRPKNFELMFESVPIAIHLMTNSTLNKLRYVEFDSRAGGSHQMLYTWIYDDSERLDCRKVKSMNTQTKVEIFPTDVTWEKFYQEKETLVR